MDTVKSLKMLENVTEVRNNGTIVLIHTNQTQLFVVHCPVGLGSRKRLICPDSCFVNLGVVARKVFSQTKIPTKVAHLLFLPFSLIFTVIMMATKCNLEYELYTVIWANEKRLL